MAATLELVAKENISEAMFKLEQQHLRLTEQVKQLGQASRRSHQEAATSLDQVNAGVTRSIGLVTSLTGTFLGLAGAKATIDLLKTAYQEWMREMEQLGKKNQEFAESFTAGIARSRDAAASLQISAALQAMPGLLPDKARQVFEGITSTAPSESVERRLELTRQASKTDWLHKGKLGDMGVLYGKINAIVPGLSAEETAGLAEAVYGEAGQHVEALTGDKFMRTMAMMQAGGIEPERAMAKVIIGMEKGQTRGSAAMAGAEAIAKDWEIIKPTRGHRVLTADEKAKNRFAAASMSERERMLDSDPAIRKAVLGEAALEYGLIDSATVAERAAKLKLGRQPGYAEQKAFETARSPEGFRAQLADQQEERLYQAETVERKVGTRLERAQGRYKKYTKSLYFFERPFARMAWEGAKLIAPEAPEYAFGGGPHPEAIATMRKEAREEEPEIGYREMQVKILNNIERNTRGPQAAGVQANVNSQSENDPAGGARGVNPK